MKIRRKREALGRQWCVRAWVWAVLGQGLIKDLDGFWVCCLQWFVRNLNEITGWIPEECLMKLPLLVQHSSSRGCRKETCLGGSSLGLTKMTQQVRYLPHKPGSLSPFLEPVCGKKKLPPHTHTVTNDFKISRKFLGREMRPHSRLYAFRC